MRRVIIAGMFGCLLLSPRSVFGQVKFTTKLAMDPNEAEFIIDDVENFIRVHKLLSDESDMVEVLQAEYFDKGTVGLATFVEKYELTAERLAKAIGKREKAYASLDKSPPWLASQRDSLRAAFVEFKRIVPQAVFPPTYFLVGSYRGIGSGSPEGQLISVEKFDPSKKKHLDTLIVHELTHFQQAMATGPEEFYALFGPKKSLVGLTIREGTAEFLADRVTGAITQSKARAYVIEHEKKLWKRFEKEMNGRETGEWMWKTPSDPNQPPHIAYMIGYRIVEAYYNRAGDKGEAIRKILSVTDYPAFLEQSGYAKQFAD